MTHGTDVGYLRYLNFCLTELVSDASPGNALAAPSHFAKSATIVPDSLSTRVRTVTSRRRPTDFSDLPTSFMATLIRFILQTVGTGAIAGLLLIWAFPQLINIPEADREKSDPGQATSVTPEIRAASPTTTAGARLSFASAVIATAPAVVNVYTTKKIRQQIHPFFNDPFFNRFFGDNPLLEPRERLQASLGSGVVAHREGYLLTNHHVVDGADEIKVALRDGRSAVARLIGTDPDTDLAVLKTDLDALPTIRFGNSDTVAVGDLVLAIGNPFGVGQTVTMGIVSATGRQNLGINTYENFIQTDAAINPGNSGGALVTIDGELVGINTAIYSRTGGSQGIGFAVPVKLAKRVLDDIIDHGRVIRGWLGVTVQEVTGQVASSLGIEGERGVAISGIFRDSPAARSGMRRGDVIEQIDGVPVISAYQTMQQIAELSPGNTVLIRLSRGGNRMEREVTVAERPLVPTRP